MKKVELTEGKRYLVSSRFKMGMGIDSIVECEIIEISPSKQYIKNKVWRNRVLVEIEGI
mgnify:FL=1